MSRIRLTNCAMGGGFRPARVLTLLTAFFGVFAMSCAAATASPFQHGDMLATGSGSLQEYTPSGDLVQTVGGTSGAGPICVSPDGNWVVLPGVGVLNRLGRFVPSAWASLAPAQFGNTTHCAINRDDEVFYSGAAGYTFAKFTLTGKLVQGYSTGLHPSQGEGLAVVWTDPSDCTVLISTWGPIHGITPYNVCTQTLTESGFETLADDVATLPNGDVISLYDFDATLWDATGNYLGVQWVQPFGPLVGSRWVSVDPVADTVWQAQGDAVEEYDMNTGMELNQWGAAGPNGEPVAGHPGGPIAIYDPPLPPTCTPTAVRRVGAGWLGQREQEDVTVQAQGGIASINNTHVDNGSLTEPQFSAGATKLVVTVTKARPLSLSHWSFDVTDEQGQSTHCSGWLPLL